MSATEAAFFQDEKPPVKGWVWAAAAVVVMHVILVYLIIHVRDKETPNGVETPPAIMIDLAPQAEAPPVAQETQLPPAPTKTEEAPPDEMTPPTPPDVAPPPPEPPPPQMVEPPPTPVPPPPETITVPEAPLAPKPEAVLPPPQKPAPPPPKPAPKVEKKVEKVEKVQKVVKPEHKPAAERTAAPRHVDAPPARAGAAATARPSGVPSVSNAEWGSEVRARIMSVKSCPGGAGGASGVATVAFSVTGGGSLAGARLSGSSGNSALDAQAVGMVRRAGPYPATPTGGTVTLSVPIRFGC